MPLRKVKGQLPVVPPTLVHENTTLSNMLLQQENLLIHSMPMERHWLPSTPVIKTIEGMEEICKIRTEQISDIEKQIGKSISLLIISVDNCSFNENDNNPLIKHD